MTQIPTRFGDGFHWYTIPDDPRVRRLGLSPDQAKARLRHWVGDPALPLTLTAIAADDEADLKPPWKSLSAGRNYLFQAPGGVHYLAAIHPWAILTYYDPAHDTGENEPHAPLTPAARRKIAETFVAARTPNLRALPSAVVDDAPYRLGTRLAGLRHAGRHAMVWVNARTAGIALARHVDAGEPSQSPTPSLSARDALRRAAEALTAPGTTEQFAEVDGEVPELIWHPRFDRAQLRLAWDVTLLNGGDDAWVQHTAVVDAQSGEVLHQDAYAGAPNGKRRVRWTVRRPARKR